MKFLSLFLILLSLSVCSTSWSFLTHDQIVKSFRGELDESLVMSDNQKELYKEIKKNLIPLEKLIDKKTQKELDDQKNLKKINGFFVKSGQGVDLRKYDTPIKRQWNGTCTAFGLIAAMENRLEGKFDLSERDFWSRYRRYSSNVAIKTMESVRVCEEKFWPLNKIRATKECVNNHRFGLKPGVKYLGGDVDQAIKSLDAGLPVYIAMSTPSQMAQCKTIIDHNSGKTGGGHALAVVGYKLDQRLKSGGYFILKNSWGDQCGDQGYQYLDHNFCKARGRYCLMWSIDNVTDEKPTPEPALKCLKYYRPWYYLGLRKKCLTWG